MTTKRKRLIQVVAIILILVIIVNMVTTKPIRFSKEGVGKVYVAVVISTDRLTFDGEATVTKQRDIEDVVKTLNSIRAYRWGKYSVYDLEGDSPTAWATLCDRKGDEIDSITLYQDILTYGDEYYKINMSEYDKLLKICNDYGDS